MIPASLPFEYLHHFDRHDRAGRTGSRGMSRLVTRAPGSNSSKSEPASSHAALHEPSVVLVHVQGESA